MNEKKTAKTIQAAVNECIGGLDYLPSQEQEILRRITEQDPVYSKSGISGYSVSDQKGNQAKIHIRYPRRAVLAVCSGIVLLAATLAISNPSFFSDWFHPLDSVSSQHSESLTSPAESVPEPTPQERHWYTFQVHSWGISSSTNIKYLALYGPYNIDEQNAVEIGRVKGMAKEVKVYTNDPEERLIWSYSPNAFQGAFLRSDVQLPEPGPEAGRFDIIRDNGQLFPLSEAALAELEALRSRIETIGMPAEDAGIRIESDRQVSAEVFFTYREIPSLMRWLPFSFIRDGDRLIMLTWKADDENAEYQEDRVIEIDPDSELYHTVFEAIEAPEKNETGSVP